VPAMDFFILQYYGISTCNFLDFAFATFGNFILQQILTFSTRNGVIVIWYYFLGVIAMEFFHFMQGFLSSGMLDFHYTENSKIPQNRVNMPIKYH
jgi:hypothetical protein